MISLKYILDLQILRIFTLMQAFVCCRNLDLRRKQGIAGDMLLLTRQLRYFFCYSSARTMLLLAL